MKLLYNVSIKKLIMLSMLIIISSLFIIILTASPSNPNDHDDKQDKKLEELRTKQMVLESRMEPMESQNIQRKIIDWVIRALIILIYLVVLYQIYQNRRMRIGRANLKKLFKLDRNKQNSNEFQFMLKSLYNEKMNLMLVQEFKNKGYALSDKATLTARKPRKSWAINDNQQRYVIMKGKNRLKVYQELGRTEQTEQEEKLSELKNSIYKDIDSRLGKFGDDVRKISTQYTDLNNNLEQLRKIVTDIPKAEKPARIEQEKILIQTLNTINRNIEGFSDIKDIFATINSEIKTASLDFRNVINRLIEQHDSLLSNYQEILKSNNRVDTGIRKTNGKSMSEIPGDSGLERSQFSANQEMQMTTTPTLEAKTTERIEKWKPFLDFMKRYCDDPALIETLENRLREALDRQKDPSETQEGFSIFANCIERIYRMRDDKILDQILNQFAKQLKVKVYGTDIQGKLLKNAGVESTILSLGELTGPEKKMYQDNFSKTGTLQSGQIVMVVSPGIRSLYDSNWDVKPKVVLYQEQA